MQKIRVRHKKVLEALKMEFDKDEAEPIFVIEGVPVYAKAGSIWWMVGCLENYQILSDKDFKEQYEEVEDPKECAADCECRL